MIKVEGNAGELKKLDVPMVKVKRRKDGNASLLGVVDSDEETVVVPSEKNEKGEPRVTFTKDPETGALIFSDGRRVEPSEIKKADDESESLAEGTAILAEQAVTRKSAKELLKLVKAGAGAKNKSYVTASGYEFFYAKPTAITLSAIGMMLYRQDEVAYDENGEPIPTKVLTPDTVMARWPDLMTAVLQNLLVSGEDDNTPLFADEGEARAFLHSAEAATEGVEVTTEIISSVPNFMNMLHGG